MKTVSSVQEKPNGRISHIRGGNFLVFITSLMLSTVSVGFAHK